MKTYKEIFESISDETLNEKSVAIEVLRLARKTKDSKKNFYLTKRDIESISRSFNVDTEDIYQFGTKIANGDWEFQSADTLINGIEREM